jgi:Glycosyl transferase family 2
MPTFCPLGHIDRTYPLLDRAAAEIAATHEVMIVPVLNGSSADDAQALRAAVASGLMAAHVIELPDAGKNAAINAGVEHARDCGAEIVHVVDDDQEYAPGTLALNVRCLIGMRNRLGVRGLVGSRHLASVDPDETLVAWIARMAFERGQEAPKFCIGGSMCAFVEDFPPLPADEVGLADDAYLCNVVYERHRTLYQETGFMPIVFPEGSEVRFRVAQTLGEYHRQQVRIRYGVLAAYSAFPETAAEMRCYFDWRFHCDETLAPRRGWIERIREALRWQAFSLMRQHANRRAEGILASGQVGVAWSVASSTKRAGVPAPNAEKV